MPLLPDYHADRDQPSSLTRLENEQVQQPSLTFAMDLEGDTCSGTKDGLDALVQSLYCMLRTEQAAYIMYPGNYGLMTRDLYGKPAGYIEAMLEARIAETLMQDDRVTSVHDFEFTLAPDSITVAYTVDSTLGQADMKGVFNV